MKIPANGFTHAGKFHADDVFATALLQIVRPDIRITRGFVVPDELYRAAKVDGTSDLKFLCKVMIPICKPTMVTIVILKVMLFQRMSQMMSIIIQS